MLYRYDKRIKAYACFWGAFLLLFYFSLLYFEGALVEYEMIIANSYLTHSSEFIVK